MADKKNSIDDYYASIGTSPEADAADDKKKPAKVKIKKKVDTAENAPSQPVVSAPEIVVVAEPAPVQPNRLTEKKPDDRRPKISFAPVEKSKPFEPLSRRESPRHVERPAPARPAPAPAPSRSVAQV
ncbi:MAG TPA: hypothetical protein PK765_04640 [bacterium]|nr:hypothetical protein [bacterium]